MDQSVFVLNEPQNSIPHFPAAPPCGYLSRVSYLNRFLGLALLWFSCQGAFGEGTAVITHVADIRGLSREQAKLNSPVQLRGVVTWVGSTNWFIFQDETGGVTVNVGLAHRSGVWPVADTNIFFLQAGDEVVIEGEAHAAGFAPIVLPRSLRVLGNQPLPPARPMVPARFFTGADACERIEVRGVVQGFKREDAGTVMLQIDANPGKFIVEVPNEIIKAPQELVDAEVCLRGVAGTFFNSRRELTRVRLMVSRPEDVIVEKPAAASPFEVPRLAINELCPFRPTPLGPHRQRVEGTVIYGQSGHVFYIQDQDTAVRVETLALESLEPGDRVEVSGFVNMQRPVAGLVGAIVRKTGKGTVPWAVYIRPVDVLAINTKALLRGQAPESNDFDGRLITFRGRLVNIQPSWDRKPPWQRLSINADGIIVEAQLYKGDTKAFEDLQVGSELEVTGIVQLDFAVNTQNYYTPQQRPPTGMKVLLRSFEDVTLVTPPSWWNSQRLRRVLSVSLVLLLGVLFWLWQLRRQLARSTRQLAVEMRARRDASVEFQAALRERNRLAVNLHDTLLQTLSGLNYQLEACESESLPAAERKSNYLETARRMLNRAQEDLRNTVWALRVLPLPGRTLIEALQTLIDQLSRHHPVKITLVNDFELPKLSEFVSGNLLLVAQEAMQNAIKHSRATLLEIQVSLSPDEKHIVLEVRDNGVGFDLSPGKIDLSRHFGLTGMRERIERLEGRFHITSQPGQGTRIKAEVVIRPFDEELAK